MKRKSKSGPDKSKRSGASARRWTELRDGVADYLDDEAFDRRLDQGVDFLRRHGFAGSQLEHLFRLDSRRQKLMYVASVAGATVAVTLFSRSFVGRTLKRVPFLSWG